MALTPEQQAQLEELNKLANEPDEDEDFDIEIYDEHGRGARVPYRKGKDWLNKHFGVDLGEAPKDEGQSPKQKGKQASSKNDDEGTQEPNLKLFRQRQGQPKAS